MNPNGCISIIIPTINEAYFIPKLIPHLKKNDTERLVKEIIVVDAGSNDDTCKVAKKHGAQIVYSHRKNRAIQMNLGAKNANSEILHFVHADSFPPKGFSSEIIRACETSGAGCFRSLFDTKDWFLRTNSWFTRFQGTFFRGGGQTLFIKEEIFSKLEGYNESIDLMEEYELIQRIKKITAFKVIQKDVLVSARDYTKHGHWKLQAKYGLIYLFFFTGCSQKTVKKVHNWLMKT